MSSFFDALVHGLALPSEILRAGELSPRLRALLGSLVDWESVPSPAMDFLKAYRSLSEQTISEHQILIQNRVDLSELELSYLFRMAEFGVPVHVELPVDASNQGFNLAVNSLATQIERRHDLKNIRVSFKPFEKPNRHYFYEAADLVQEARWAAQVVAGFGPEKRVAVAMRVVDSRALVFQDALKAHGVSQTIWEFPKLLGKKFDHVVIVDAAHGRLTLSREPDWPLTDSECFEINCLMKRTVLRRFEADPLEPSLFAPRQALEPLWFLGSIAAACDSVIITSSKQDQNSQAQMSSELIRLVDLGKPMERSALVLRKSAQERRFEQSKSKNLPKLPSRPLGLQIDPNLLRQHLPDALGQNPARPMSATLIEAMARCHFQAFTERMLQIDFKPDQGQDLDARLIGRAAHLALERYYRDGRNMGETLRELNPEGVHAGIWEATILWLENALNRLINQARQDPPLEGAKPVAFEQKLGPMNLSMGDEQIYIGGVADRVDAAPGVQAVIDYKLSNLATLRQKMAAKEVLKTHFQIPIYLRLLSKSGSNERYVGYPLSIRDGAPGPIVEMTERLEEIDQAIRELVEPVLKGFIAQDLGLHCDTCSLRRVCRVA
ncbi:MAG: PD-(D/E)XK nuclease family protein [Myxococcaceae bacterium]|nr:PD-(D/E)XK nuclease family protein [Myxococcaceae bacterium]MBH2005859.1 PD-(D/E)XK nuclease family protein [Myxococcaceae bacterium]